MATYSPSYDHESNGTWAATNVSIEYPPTPPSQGIFGSTYHGPHLGTMDAEVLSYFQNEILYTDGFFDAHENAKYNPLSAIMKCHKLPITIPSTLRHEETDFITLNGHVYNFESENNLKMWYLIDQWRRVDCGYVDIPLYFDGFMDMAPYTKIQVYLPFIGFQDINPALCVGGRIGILYIFNMCTGDCIAHIGCTDKNGVQQVITSATGNAALSAPITGANDLTKWNTGMAIINGAISAVTAVATGGLSLLATGTGTKSAGQLQQMVSSGKVPEALLPAVQSSISSNIAAVNAARTSQLVNAGTALSQGLGNSVSSIMNTPITSGSAGDITGSNGAMAYRTPFVMISRPHYCIPENYASQYGYPSNITDTIANFQGYLEVGSVHLDSIVATATEKAEIDSLLKSGIIVPRVSSS